MERMKKVLSAVGEILYPRHAQCMGCGDPAGTDEGWLCAECAGKVEELRIRQQNVCPRCGTPLNGTDACTDCADWGDTCVRAVRYVYGYAQPLSSAIHRMKYGGVYKMAEWMGHEIAGMMRGESVFGGAEVLVPVPMHPARRRQRGRNHALCIAQAVAAETGLPLCEAVNRIRNTKQQVKRSGAERRTALQGAFAIDERYRDAVAGKKVVVIDDVVTTGSSVNGVAEVLYAAGAAEVYAATFAGERGR